MPTLRACVRRLISGPVAERGAAAVEFALVLPLLVVLVFGIVDFAGAYNARITLNAAAAEGARSLAVNANTTATATQIQASAQSAVNAVLNPPTVLAAGAVSSVFQTCQDSTASPKEARVTLTTTFALTIPVGPWRTVSFQGVGVRQCVG